MRNQRTIRRSIECSGIGLHTGQKVRLVLEPAPPDTGVVFNRTDVADFRLRAGIEAVGGVDYATSLKHGEHRLGTVEHLLSALAGLGVDNVQIEVDASEVPILDGSAAPFVYLIHEAGIRQQNRPRRAFRVRKPVEVSCGDARVAVYPYDGLKVTYSIEFDHPAIRRQSISLEVRPGTFQEEIAPARTFGFLREVEKLRRAGLARGGSLDNAVVLGDHGVLNAPLRYTDEFVRHKILDLVGDVSLLGMPILGHVVAHKAGHAVHTALVRRLRSDPMAGEVVVPGVEASVSPVPVLAPLSPRILALARG